MPYPPIRALVLGVAGLVVMGAGCGGAKSPPAKAPEAAAAAAAPAPSAATNSPSASTVSISDDIRTKCGISNQDAYVPFDSSRLTSNDRSPLDLVAKCFTAGPLKGHAVKLVGRADPRGETDYNVTLGQSRADAVGQYLVAHGMNKAKESSTSRGAMDATGTSEASWQKDRRVDVMLGN